MQSFELTDNDYAILKYVSQHPSSEEQDIIAALNGTVDSIFFRLDQLSKGDMAQRANNTTYAIDAYLSRTSYANSHAYSITSRGAAALQDHTSKKKSDKRELWLKNAWIPIIVSFVTTVLAMHIIPKLPQILKWFFDTLSKIFSR